MERLAVLAHECALRRCQVAHADVASKSSAASALMSDWLLLEAHVKGCNRALASLRTHDNSPTERSAPTFECQLESEEAVLELTKHLLDEAKKSYLSANAVLNSAVEESRAADSFAADTALRLQVACATSSKDLVLVDDSAQSAALRVTSALEASALAADFNRSRAALSGATELVSEARLEVSRLHAELQWERCVGAGGEAHEMRDAPAALVSSTLLGSSSRPVDAAAHALSCALERAAAAERLQAAAELEVGRVQASARGAGSAARHELEAAQRLAREAEQAVQAAQDAAMQQQAAAASAQAAANVAIGDMADAVGDAAEARASVGDAQRQAEAANLKWAAARLAANVERLKAARSESQEAFALIARKAALAREQRALQGASIAASSTAAAQAALAECRAQLALASGEANAQRLAAVQQRARATEWSNLYFSAAAPIVEANIAGAAAARSGIDAINDDLGAVLALCGDDDDSDDVREDSVVHGPALGGAGSDTGGYGVVDGAGGVVDGSGGHDSSAGPPVRSASLGGGASSAAGDASGVGRKRSRSG